jgi:hypothetical protein
MFAASVPLAAFLLNPAMCGSPQHAGKSTSRKGTLLAARRCGLLRCRFLDVSNPVEGIETRVAVVWGSEECLGKRDRGTLKIPH